MTIVYQLSSDIAHIEAVQKATRTTRDFGIEPTHGLFGSEEWWAQIRSGCLPTQTVRGSISRVYMGSMGDWPEFEVETEEHERLAWSRFANSPHLEALYEVGRAVEVDYVLQRHRPAAYDRGGTTKVVIEVRIGEAA